MVEEKNTTIKKNLINEILERESSVLEKQEKGSSWRHLLQLNLCRAQDKQPVVIK